MNAVERAVREKFEGLLARTNHENPSLEDVEQLRQALRESPELLEYAGSLAQQSQQVLLNSVKMSAAAREVLEAGLAGGREALGGEDTSPLERMLIENISLCYLRYYLWECSYHAKMGNSTDARLARDWEAMLNQAQKRYLRAIETLTRVRRLNIAVQVNIAAQGGQQVNVLANHMTAQNKMPNEPFLCKDNEADAL